VVRERLPTLEPANARLCRIEQAALLVQRTKEQISALLPVMSCLG
jgi:hypothetical protein